MVDGTRLRNGEETGWVGVVENREYKYTCTTHPLPSLDHSLPSPVFYLENFFCGGSFKYVWEGPTCSTKILQRMHGEMKYTHFI